jgi:hypothetical protein
MPNPNMAARNPDHLALVEDGVQEVSETIGAKVEMKDLCVQHYGPNLEEWQSSWHSNARLRICRMYLSNLA